MRYFIGLVCVLALGALATVGCSESKPAEPDLEWPPNATAYFDEYGILNADCATDEDCAMVLGYYHAADRFVQMDFRRRFATGRLTEIVDKDSPRYSDLPNSQQKNALSCPRVTASHWRSLSSNEQASEKSRCDACGVQRGREPMD